MHTSEKAIAVKKPTGNQTLAIVATEFHMERRESYYKVRFRDLDGQKQNILIGRELFTTPPRVVAELLKANADLPDNPKTAVELVKQAVATRSKRSRRITIRTGWHDTSFVYLGETFGPLAGKLKHEDTSPIDPALGLKRGSLRAWREGLTNSFRYSDYLIFAASVAFSGPLFDLAGEQEGVVFHFQPQNSAPQNKESKAKSSSGKTLAARVAVSTIGRPKKTDLISFAVTERGLEDYCYSHSNLIGALDEEGRALSGTGKHIKPSQLPYQLTSGRGTYRSQKAIRDPDLQNLTWLLPFISTGEKPLDDPKNESARMEGAQVRMAPIPVPAGADGGIFNRLDGSREAIVEKGHLLVREVEETLVENYGVVMPAYLRKLVPQRSSLAPRVRRIMDKFVEKVGANSDPWERRFAEKFGIVLAGAIFASEFGVAPWTTGRAWSAGRTIYRRSRAALASVSETTDALVCKIRKALTTDRFPWLDKGQIIKPEHAGRALGVTRKLATHGPTVLIALPQLKGLIKPCATSSAVLADLAKRGILIKSPEGKSTRETMIRGLNGSKRRRYVALKLSALMEAS
jgi:putative DNA primase/helicase